MSNYQVIIEYIEYKYWVQIHVPLTRGRSFNCVLFKKTQWIFVPFSGVIKYIQKLIILYKLNGIVLDLQDYIF